MRRKSSCFCRRPRTVTTLWDVQRMFHNHPIKTSLALPVAFLALGVQMILYYATIPFVALHYFISKV